VIPVNLKESTKISVTIICEKGERYDHVYIETDSLLGATRIINTYQPKRGYRVVHIKIDEVLTLQ
jgi:hypothetical protein